MIDIQVMGQIHKGQISNQTEVAMHTPILWVLLLVVRDNLCSIADFFSVDGFAAIAQTKSDTLLSYSRLTIFSLKCQIYLLHTKQTHVGFLNYVIVS